MALWGKSTSDESRPKWLRENDKPANDLNRCFADQRGWVLRHANGFEEVLVTISGLSGAGSTTAGLGAATIAGVYFKAASYAKLATGTVIVNYNEKVTVSSGATIGVAGTTTWAIATAATQTSVQQVEFTFTVPNVNQVISIPAGSITGTIVDSGTSVVSDKLIANEDVKGVTGYGIVKTISVA